MRFRMPGRSKRPDSQYEQFERRVPEDVAERVHGQFVVLEFAPMKGDKRAVVSTTLGRRAKFSLRTTDPEVADARRAAAIAHLSRVYDAARSGPKPLDHKDMVAYSGEVYHLFVRDFERNPGSRQDWAAFKAFTRAAREGRVANAPAIELGAFPRESAEAQVLFGDDLTAGIDALPRSDDTTALEMRFGNLLSWVLTRHGLVVDGPTRAALLRMVADAALDAGWRLKRAADGDYSPDPKELRFPPLPASPQASGTGILDLFDAWARERRPIQSTIDQWRKHVEAFIAHSKVDDAKRVTKAMVAAWKDSLFEGGDAPKYINDSKLAALRKAFAWGVKNDRIAANPAAGVSVDYQAKMEDDMEEFSGQEAEAILVAAAKETRRPPIYWIPLLCATSGARVGEIAQLRTEDVFLRDGMPVMKIKDEAGSVKNRNSQRVVPIHPAVVELGFVRFAASQTGPLFYGERRNPNAKKPPHQIVRKNVGAWVHTLGLRVGRKHRKDPSHAWRHRFTTLAREADVNDSVIDLIKGNAPESVSRGYGTATLTTMLRAIERVPVPRAALKAYAESTAPTRRAAVRPRPPLPARSAQTGTDNAS